MIRISAFGIICISGDGSTALRTLTISLKHILQLTPSHAMTTSIPLVTGLVGSDPPLN